MDLLTSAERVDVEAAVRRRPEAGDEVDLGPRDGDPLPVAVELVHEQRRHDGSGLGRGHQAAVNCGGRVHRTIYARAGRPRKQRPAAVSVSSNLPRRPPATFGA